MIFESEISDLINGEIINLYDRINWESVIEDTQLAGRYYNEISCASLIKATLLQFLLPLASERRLAKAILEREQLQKICGFSQKAYQGTPNSSNANESIDFIKLNPKKIIVPTRSTFWFFRNDQRFQLAFHKAIIKGLVAIAVNSKFEYPFFTWTIAPASINLASNITTSLTLGREKTDIIVSYQSNYPINLKNEQLSFFPEFHESNKKINKSKTLKKTLSNALGLPITVKLEYPENVEKTLVLQAPIWLKHWSKESDTLHGLNSNSSEPYSACNILLFDLTDPKRKILLLGRRKMGGWTGNFGLPGGRMQITDQDIKDCVIRELKEETNLEVERKNIFPVSYHRNYFTGKPPVFSVGVAILKFEGQLRQREKSQTEEWKWFEINNLPQPISPPAMQVIKSYLDKPHKSLNWEMVETERSFFFAKPYQPMLIPL